MRELTPGDEFLIAEAQHGLRILPLLSVLVAGGHALSVVAQPNIIHIVADDLGWTDLSTGATNLGNGSQFYQTPNIDSLAAVSHLDTAERRCDAELTAHTQHPRPSSFPAASLCALAFALG